MKKNKPFANSVRSNDRWNKTYFPMYKENGKTIVLGEEPYQRRSEAEDRGRALQIEADARMKAESDRIKAELAQLEREALTRDAVQ